MHLTKGVPVLTFYQSLSPLLNTRASAQVEYSRNNRRAPGSESKTNENLLIANLKDMPSQHQQNKVQEADSNQPNITKRGFRFNSSDDSISSVNDNKIVFIICKPHLCR
jgi:hypothetical protein